MIAWCEAEFDKRRAKRETRDRIRGFPFQPEIGNRLFGSAIDGQSEDINAAGLLLANALLGVGNGDEGPNSDAASALKTALERGAIDSRPFTEALRTMASNPEIMQGINAILGISEQDELDAMSVDEEVNEQGVSTRSSNEHVFTPEMEDRPEELVKTLNAASAMLKQINNISDKPHQDMANGQTNGFTAINGSGPVEKEAKNDTNHDEGEGQLNLDQQQIDAILRMANGGTLDDEDDEDAPPTASELESLVQSAADTGQQHDDDVSATLQKFIAQLSKSQNGDVTMSEKPNGSASNGTTHGVNGVDPYAPVITSVADPYGNSSSTSALSSLLTSSGVSINTVIPAAQSHATSQLYHRLSVHSRSRAADGAENGVAWQFGEAPGTNPVVAKSFGNTGAMNKPLRGKSGISSKSKTNGVRDVEMSDRESSVNSASGHARSKLPAPGLAHFALGARRFSYPIPKRSKDDSSEEEKRNAFGKPPTKKIKGKER